MCLFVVLIGVSAAFAQETSTPTRTTTPTSTPTQTPTSTNTSAPTAVCAYDTTGAPFGRIQWNTKSISDTDTHTLVDAPTGNQAGATIQLESYQICVADATTVTLAIGSRSFPPYVATAAGCSPLVIYGANLPACLGTGSFTIDQSDAVATSIFYSYRIQR